MTTYIVRVFHTTVTSKCGLWHLSGQRKRMTSLDTRHLIERWTLWCTAWGSCFRVNIQRWHLYFTPTGIELWVCANQWRRTAADECNIQKPCSTTYLCLMQTLPQNGAHFRYTEQKYWAGWNVVSGKTTFEMWWNSLTCVYDRIVTGDETWVRHYDPKSKYESILWLKKSAAPPKKFKVTKSVGKLMATVTVFWDSNWFYYWVYQKTPKYNRSSLRNHYA